MKDLQVFVEVLHTFCDDPRELVEVRASEAGLKNQLSLLQKQLKGNELQVQPSWIFRPNPTYQTPLREVHLAFRTCIR